MNQLKIVIIEDEQKAASDLAANLTALDEGIRVLAILDSVAASVQWLQTNPAPDLLFMDIHLGDGSCFAIFKQVQLTCPVIFCTAYDEYALEAIRLNGIGYIVKPVDQKALADALQKYRVLEKHYEPSSAAMEALARTVREQPRFKTTFLLHVGSRIVPLPVDAIACIYVKQEQTYIVTADDELLIAKTLEQLQAELDPALFYRANRQHIVSFRFIKEVEQLAGRKIGIILRVPFDEAIVVSKDAASGFKTWLQDR